MSSNFKGLISNKIFLIFGSALVIFVGSIVVRQLQQKSSVEKEIGELSTQAQGLEQKNQDLQNLLAYLQTGDYKQKAARQQLNLKKDGEVVYTFADQPTQDTPAVSSSSAQAAPAAQDSNPKKWWNYFFNPNN